MFAGRHPTNVDGKPYTVPAAFRIWVRRAEPHALLPHEPTHLNSTFPKTAEGADFAIHRAGTKAGSIHHNMTASSSSDHFIQGDVEAVRRQLHFASVIGNVAGNPGLAKAETVALYRVHVRKAARTGRVSRR